MRHRPPSSDISNNADGTRPELTLSGTSSSRGRTRSRLTSPSPEIAGSTRKISSSLWDLEEQPSHDDTHTTGMAHDIMLFEPALPTPKATPLTPESKKRETFQSLYDQASSSENEFETTLPTPKRTPPSSPKPGKQAMSQATRDRTSSESNKEAPILEEVKLISKPTDPVTSASSMTSVVTTPKEQPIPTANEEKEKKTAMTVASSVPAVMPEEDPRSESAQLRSAMTSALKHLSEQKADESIEKNRTLALTAYTKLIEAAKTLEDLQELNIRLTPLRKSDALVMYFLTKYKSSSSSRIKSVTLFTDKANLVYEGSVKKQDKDVYSGFKSEATKIAAEAQENYAGTSYLEWGRNIKIAGTIISLFSSKEQSDFLTDMNEAIRVGDEIQAVVAPKISLPTLGRSS